MCIMLVAFEPFPGFSLAILHNRDEYRTRPSRAAHLWNGPGKILAGVDGEAGGTWLGITQKGRFAAVTNFRDPSLVREGLRSRGELVRDFLHGEEPAQDYLDQLVSRADAYNPFNLMLSDDLRYFHYLTNTAHLRQSFATGRHILSNAHLDTPWPKVRRLDASFRELQGDRLYPEQDLSEALFRILQDRTLAPPECLPRTGLPEAVELQLSPVFIEGETYGTVASTVILQEKTGRILFWERSYGSAGVIHGNVHEVLEP